MGGGWVSQGTKGWLEGSKRWAMSAVASEPKRCRETRKGGGPSKAAREEDSRPTHQKRLEFEDKWESNRSKDSGRECTRQELEGKKRGRRTADDDGWMEEEDGLEMGPLLGCSCAGFTQPRKWVGDKMTIPCFYFLFLSLTLLFIRWAIRRFLFCLFSPSIYSLSPTCD